MEWRPIPNFEAQYEVSDCGQVRNVVTGLVLKPRQNERGYWRVGLFRPKPQRQLVVPIHRLVALAFIPNPGGLPQVNHVDRNKQNNHVSNLEWVDNLTNHRHSADRFLVINNPRRHVKLSVDDVASIRRDLAAGVKPRVLASKWNVNVTTIYRIRLNRAREFEPSAQQYTPPEPQRKVRRLPKGERAPPRVVRFPRKMNLEKAEALRAMRAAGASAKECGIAFGLGHNQTYRILSGAAWPAHSEQESDA